MKNFHHYLLQAKAFATNAKCGIGLLCSHLKTLYGSISAYIQTVINREMPSFHVKDLPQSKKEITMKITVWESKALWYFNIKAGNGKIIAASEGYSKKYNALKTIHSLKLGIPLAKVIE